MQRVTRSTAAAVPLAPPAAPGAPGHFTGGNPLTGVPATVPGYEWYEGVQEEPLGVIEYLGIAPSHSDHTLLRKALARWFGGGVRTISSNITLSADDAGVVMASAASGNVGVILPAAAAANGRPLRFTFVRTDTNAANLVTLQGAGTNTINGQTTWPILVGERLTLVSDGAGTWFGLSSTGRLLNVRTFATPGSATYTPTAATNSVEVEVIGGGGGGGPAAPTLAGQVSAGSGGGGGGYTRKRVTAGFAGVTLTVGAGGNSGALGNTSSFGVHCLATGGTAGLAGSPQVPPTGSWYPVGGAGAGMGSGGDVNASGGYGKFALYGSTPTSGEGGGSFFGPGAVPASGTSSGNSSNTPGGGGSGGSLMPSSSGSALGGRGGGGLIIVREYS
ncbi:MAG TPA: hypothetical protein VGM87_25550 [Roseomonas sp.]|jgi:hypothetical protein